MMQHKLASFDLASPFDSNCFTVTYAMGNIVPRKFPNVMEVVYLSFE